MAYHFFKGSTENNTVQISLSFKDEIVAIYHHVNRST